MKIVKQLLKCWNKSVVFIVGFLSLVWFLIRVIPKPSRAAYPCQRAAFPLASGFVMWLTGSFVSFFSIKKARETSFRTEGSRKIVLYITGIMAFIISWFIIPEWDTYAKQSRQLIAVETAPPVINWRTTEEVSMSTPISTVTIVKSSRENSSEITYDDIESMIREAVNKTDEFNNLIKDNITVVIKPNIVSNTDWSNNPKQVPAENNGMVTDYRVIKAIVKLVRELNPNGKVYVLEGSADNTTRANMASLKYSYTEIPGLTDFIYLEENSGEWEDWNSQSMVKVVLPANKTLYPDNLKPNQSAEFYLNKIYYEADVLISVPVLKNHSMTSVTGSVKNVGIGATPQNIYGGSKSNHHRYVNDRIDHTNLTNLHKFIHDFYLCRPVDYTIMEGLQGNENGPVAERASNLESVKKNMRLILAGKDAVAVDAIASLIMAYDPLKVNHLVYLHNDSAGCADPKYIRVLGPEINTIQKSFNHWAQTGPKFSDVLPPDVSIDLFEIKNNLLHFAINPAENDPILKVEVVINNQLYPQDIIDGFENIEIDISAINLADTMIQIKVYDKYLNCKKIKYKGEQLITGIKEGTLNYAINIFPNPIDDYLIISSDYEDIGKIRIRDINGHIVYASGISGKTLRIERNNIPSGNYIMETYTARDCFISKVIFR